MQHRTEHTPSLTPAAASTRALLACGIAAGPLYLGVALAQAVTRDGFDITRHAVSLLSLGPLGWVQVANFVMTGLLVMASGAGLWRAGGGGGVGPTAPDHGVRSVRSGPGGAWGPALLAVYGVALIASGIFPADAGFGFPPGTPSGPPSAMTTAGTLHFAVGGIGFMALIAACLVFARRYQASGDVGMAGFSAATGVVFLVSFMGIASGPPRPATVAGLWLGLALTWLWLATVAWRTRSALGPEPAAAPARMQAHASAARRPDR